MQANFKYPKIFFILTFVLILYVFYRMLEPFLIAVILGVTLVSLFYPNYLQLNSRLKGHSNLSSLIMCTVITLLIILPLILFFLALFNEINSAYVDFRQQLRTGQWGLKIPVPENSIVEMFGNRLVGYLGVEEMDLTLIASSIVDRVARYLLDHYSGILGGIGSFFFKFFIMIFSMFFFFRDGDILLRELKTLIPMAPKYKDMVVDKLREVTYATFFGIFGTGICQGVAAGLIFWGLGINNPTLWAAATALVSLIPVIGTATIWVPLSIYLILTGYLGKGIVLLMLGSGVIGLVDNFVRPLIIEGRSEGMHLLLVFFSLAGGLILFGPSGLVLGPLVSALLVTFLDIYRAEFREEP